MFTIDADQGFLPSNQISICSLHLMKRNPYLRSGFVSPNYPMLVTKSSLAADIMNRRPPAGAEPVTEPVTERLNFPRASGYNHSKYFVEPAVPSAML